MIGKLQLTVLTTCIMIALSACAQTKTSAARNTKQKKADYALFITEFKQTLLPGRPVAGSGPQTTHKYIIVWNSNIKPETFFWKDGNTWLPCNVYKISNYTPSAIDGKNPYPEIYTSKEISLFDVNANDTLELAPYTGGKFPIPQDLPASNPNTIYFKAVNTTWHILPVTNTMELPDIIMQ